MEGRGGREGGGCGDAELRAQGPVCNNNEARTGGGVMQRALCFTNFSFSSTVCRSSSLTPSPTQQHQRKTCQMVTIRWKMVQDQVEPLKIALSNHSPTFVHIIQNSSHAF